MERFEDWKQPTIEHGKLTQWNWLVQHPENLVLGYKTDIGSFTYINAKYGVVIEDQVQIGSHCSIYSCSTIDNKNGKIILKKNVRVGTHCTIMPGVTIGENTLIGAHSFVNKDLPANAIAFGTPARIISTFKPTDHEKNRNLLSTHPTEKQNYPIPITKATLPSFEEIAPECREFFSTGMITNHIYVKKLEETLQKYLGVKHVVAVSSCTAGMMLVLKALELQGEVIVPSFTFCATGHAILWNGLTPKFVEIDPETLTIDPKKVREAITSKTSAILGVHIFGCPAEVQKLEQIAREHNIKLIFDAAHALGAKVESTFVGNFGDAEIFSCSPTKLLVTAEGGIVTTNNDELARKIRIGRTYGDPGDYNCEFPGLSARMSEFNALLGLKSHALLEHNIECRQKLVQLYKKKLEGIPGIQFQLIHPSSRTTHKDFSLFINHHQFGMNRDQLADELLKRGIGTKKYFYPPLHLQKAYHSYYEQYKGLLKLTEHISQNVLSLPLYSHMQEQEILFIARVITEIHHQMTRT